MKLALCTVLAFLVLNGFEGVYEVRKFPKSSLSLPSNETAQLLIQSDEVGFFMIADWGGLPFFPYRTIVQQNVANKMKKLSKKSNIHFTMALGDNFYFQGVKDEEDPRFKTTFEDVFDSSDLNMPWFIQLGNHDYQGNETAQIAYTKKSKRWILPRNFYSVDIDVLNGTQKLIHLLMIDTVLLCGSSDDMNFDLNLSGEKKKASNRYFKQIENELKMFSKQKIPYIIIAGHYPVWAVGEHGPTYLLVQKLRPLLFKYKVTAYFSGHEHDAEHFSEEKSQFKTHFIVNGATDTIKNDMSHLVKVPKGLMKFHWASNLNIHGVICVVRANIKEMVIEYIETSGKKLHEIKVQNKWLTKETEFEN